MTSNWPSISARPVSRSVFRSHLIAPWQRSRLRRPWCVKCPSRERRAITGASMLARTSWCVIAYRSSRRSHLELLAALTPRVGSDKTSQCPVLGCNKLKWKTFPLPRPLSIAGRRCVHALKKEPPRNVPSISVSQARSWRPSARSRNAARAAAVFTEAKAASCKARDLRWVD